MTCPPDKDATAVAKQQRTIQLPPDIYQLAEAAEYRTRAKFNRQVLAAILQFYFADPEDGPPSVWMQLATAVEKGDIPVGDVPIVYNEARIREAQEYIGKPDEAKLHPSTEEFAKEQLAEAQKHLAWWKGRAEGGDTPVDGYIAHWRHIGEVAQKWARKTQEQAPPETE